MPTSPETPSMLVPETLIRQIHASGRPCVIAVTGGGTFALAALLQVPGGSRTLLEGLVPYSEAALIDFLRARPEQFCSEATARAMGVAAWHRAARLAGQPGDELLGLGCTASLVSDPPKRGPHRAHLGVQSATHTSVISLNLEKGARHRAAEEALVGGLILNELSNACGIRDRIALDLVAEERVDRRQVAAPPDWQALWIGKRVSLLARGSLPGQGRHALFPGAFHPLHAAHLKISQIATQVLGQSVAFEISVTNVDKPPLDFLEIETRLRQFPSTANVWLTRAPTFVEKSSAFPDTTFVVGADTIARIAEPKYYGGSLDSRNRAIDQLASHGARFLVFGRLVGDRFLTLADLTLPESLTRLCQGMGEQDFRLDLSSTEIRRGSTAANG